MFRGCIVAGGSASGVGCAQHGEPDVHVPAAALPGPPGPGRCRPPAPRPGPCAAAKSSGGSVRGDGSDGLPSQPTLSRFVDRLSGEENLDVLKEGILANGLRRIPEVCRRPADVPVVDVDDVPFLADGHQPGSQYCGYVGHRCYSALVAVSGESGNILGAPPRRPGEDKAGETFDYVPIVAGALEEGDERTVFHEHVYQAWNWSCKRRVALGVTFSERELIPRHFWLITSLAREDVGAEELLARYRVRGQGGEHLRRTEEHAAGAASVLSATGAPVCMQDDRSFRPARGNGLTASKRSPSPARLARLSGHARGPLRDPGRLREMLEPRHFPRKGSARWLPRGPARKAHETLHHQIRGKPLGHPATAAAEVRHARRVARSPAPLPSPANPEAGGAEPWDPALQTRRKRPPFSANSPQPTRSSHASVPYGGANSQSCAIST